MALSALTRICDDSVTISKVEYIPTTEISHATFELLEQAGIFTGALGNTSGLFTLPADFKDRVLNINPSDTNQGPLMDIQLSCRLSAKGPDIQSVLADMKRYRYILRLTADTGARMQLGTPDSPATFNYSKSFGEGQPNTYAVTFNLKTPDNLLYL